MILSVIVPVYNGEAYLKRCIDSIENAVSLLESAQVIIVDDGSKDNTPAVCTKISQKYNNIEIVIMNDEGVSAARNKGLQLSKGDYISFVDADDVVDVRMFKNLIDAMDSDTVVAGCGFYEWKDESDTPVINPDFEAKRYTPSEYVHEELLAGNSRCWSKVYRASALKNKDGELITYKEGLSIGEDMLFVSECILNAPEDSNLVELKGYQGYGYYRNPVGAINRPFTPEYMDQVLCWELLKDNLIKAQMDSLEVLTNINTKYIMAIMLTASKIAVGSSDDINKYQEQIELCHAKLIDALRFAHNLDKGYRVKAGIFKLSPSIYIKLYHKWKAK